MGLPTGVVAARGDRRSLEEELARSEARFRALVAASSQLIVRADPAGRNVEVSDSFCAFTGRPREELLGDGWIELVHPDDREALHREMFAVLENPRVLTIEFRLRRHDGVYRRFSIQAIPVWGPDGQLQELLAAGTDVEDQHRRELERRELIRALDRKRERLASIIDALPVGVVLAEAPNGRVLQTNRAFEALAKTTPIDACACLVSAGHGEHRASCPLRRAMELGLAVDGEEARLRREDGAAQIVQISAVPLRDATGAVVAGLASVVDVTDRKRAEEAARENERYLRFCLENAPAHVWMAGPDGTNTYNNNRFLDYTGLTLEESTGSGWTRAVHPDDRDRARAAWNRARETLGVYETEMRYRGADGTWRWFLTRARPLLDDEGRLVCWFGMNTDIDDLKRTRELLQASEARFRRILELDLLGMCTFRLDGRIEDANQEYLRIFGYTEADLRAGKLNWLEMNPPGDGALVDYISSELRRGGSLRPVEKECLRADGSRVPVILTAALDSPGAETGIAFVYDASTRAQLEEFQHQLIGVVGHDLRSPLAAMITTLDVLLRKHGLDPSVRRSLERVRHTAERMRRITRDLLDYTQARVGEGLAVSMEPADLRALCAGVVAEAQLLAPGRQISCQGSGDPALVCDPRRVEQALSNLLGNAIKYGDGAITVRWTADAAQAVIEVENEGTPVDRTLLPHLFRPFRQGRRGEEPMSQSLGLGLYIVREIALAHGGKAEMEPWERGNRVRLVLPRGRA